MAGTPERGYRLLKSHTPQGFGLARRFFTIFEGTSEIQQLIIARAISGLHIQ